ncbi:MAG: ornithine carbamoyltransferase [Desulfobulbus propionicus]|nr:MAG: ornithine carbamoyltransferase [Desulfobulbus propionicus]
MNHLLSLGAFSRQQLQSLIVRAIMLKNESKEGRHHQQLAGRQICLLFDKPSTRTRVSFEAAINGLGGAVIFMSSKDSQLGRGEPLKDTARVLSRYVDGIVVRTFGQEIVEELAAYSTVPVINALTDLYHPCQVLSDIMTVIECKGAPENCNFCWVGDGNNMANSWIEAAAVFGFSLNLACPEGYDPDAGVLERAQAMAAKPITIVRDPQEAVQGADVVNTDVWASMGQEEEQETRAAVFNPYQVNKALLQRAADSAIVLHCLPAHRGEEITEDVLEGPQSVIFDQAENKMHIHKAIIETLVMNGEITESR